MTQLIPDNEGLTRAKQLYAPLFEGEQPEWLQIARQDSGTSVSVADASKDGGYIRIDSADGGLIEVRSTFQLDPTAYDVVELAANVRFNSGDRHIIGLNTTDFEQELSFKSGDNSLFIAKDGNETNVSTPTVGTGNTRKFRFLWYGHEEKSQLFFDGRSAAKASVAPNRSEKVGVTLKTVDASLDIMDLALRYYHRSNAPQH